MKLSVVIATYNRAQDLALTLESLSEQTYASEEWECVVVNNNSTDDTLRIVEDFGMQYPSINVKCVTETNQGLSFARNRGIAESKGEIIAIIDDDETVNVEFVSGYCALFDNFPTAVAAGGRVVPEYITGRPEWITSYTERPIAGTLDLGNEVHLFTKGYPAGGNMAIRRTAFDRYGLFDTSLGRTGGKLLGGEEKDLMHRFAQAGGEIYYTPVPVIYHRIPASKLTDDYFSRLTYMCGVSERHRTLSASKSAYARALVAEGVKWCATLVLAAWYVLGMSTSKAVKLVEMRRGISRGLIGK